MQSKKQKILKIVAIAVGALALLLIVLISAYMLWERAPAVDPTPEPVQLLTGADKKPEEMDKGIPFDTQRQDGVYTVLLAGSDNGTGNTDAILVGRIDTVNHKMDFVSIPRDTIVNVDWSIRKINSVYWGAKNNDGDGAEALKMHVRWLLGFNVDCYAVIDLSAFIDTIDALGGVDVNVQQDIDYEDPAQNIYIHVKQGKQHLSGYDSMCYVRYRAGYITGDLGRIEAQQGFMRDAAQQFISLGTLPNASKVVDILSERTDTNLTGPNIAFFLRQALKCDADDVNFYTMPNTSAFMQGYSYAFPALGEWLEMVNAYLNPYSSPVVASNLNMIFMSGSSVGCTSEMKGAWYFEKPPEITPEPELPQTTEKPQTTTPPEVTPLPEPSTILPTEPPSTPIPTEEPGVTPTF